MVPEIEKSSDRPCSKGLEALLREATTAQRDELERALSENTPNVERIAARCLADANIRSPLGCLLSKLRNGAHIERRARTEDHFSTEEDWRTFDGALAEQNAARARALIARLTGKPPLDEDDDIPGYGDAA